MITRCYVFSFSLRLQFWNVIDSYPSIMLHYAFTLFIYKKIGTLLVTTLKILQPDMLMIAAIILVGIQYTKIASMKGEQWIFEKNRLCHWVCAHYWRVTYLILHALLKSCYSLQVQCTGTRLVKYSWQSIFAMDF